jgi:hypothetical protein
MRKEKYHRLNFRSFPGRSRPFLEHQSGALGRLLSDKAVITGTDQNSTIKAASTAHRNKLRIEADMAHPCQAALNVSS